MPDAGVQRAEGVSGEYAGRGAVGARARPAQDPELDVQWPAREPDDHATLSATGPPPQPSGDSELDVQIAIEAWRQDLGSYDHGDEHLQATIRRMCLMPTVPTLGKSRSPRCRRPAAGAAAHHAGDADAAPSEASSLLERARGTERRRQPDTPLVEAADAGCSFSAAGAAAHHAGDAGAGPSEASSLPGRAWEAARRQQPDGPLVPPTLKAVSTPAEVVAAPGAQAGAVLPGGGPLERVREAERRHQPCWPIAMAGMMNDLRARHPSLVEEIKYMSGATLRFEYLRACLLEEEGGKGNFEGKQRVLDVYGRLTDEDKEDLERAFHLAEGRRDAFILEIVTEDRRQRRKLGLEPGDSGARADAPPQPGGCPGPSGTKALPESHAGGPCLSGARADAPPQPGGAPGPSGSKARRSVSSCIGWPSSSGCLAACAATPPQPGGGPVPPGSKAKRSMPSCMGWPFAAAARREPRQSERAFSSMTAAHMSL